MNALGAARELRSFLRRNGSRTPGSAAAAAETLRAVVPSDCLALSQWDPVARRHHTLVSSYPGEVTRYLDTRLHADPVFGSVRAGGIPVRIRDLPRQRRCGETFDLVINPAGFREGVTQCLFTADGRYVGMLNASMLDTRHPDDDTVALLELLGPELAAGIDPVPVPRSPATRLGDGVTEGVLVADDGVLVHLTSRPRPELLTDALLAALAEVTGAGSWHLVHGEAVHAVEAYRTEAGTVVMHREVPPPAGLTPRELEVLAELARGRSNREIGVALGIGARTVATHVEHVLGKTGCRNRADASAQATRWGLLA